MGVKLVESLKHVVSWIQTGFQKDQFPNRLWEIVILQIIIDLNYGNNNLLQQFEFEKIED